MFEFEIVVVNPRFVYSDHSLAIPVICVLEVSSGSPQPTRDKVPFVLMWANKEPMWNTHISFWVPASIFGSLTSSACSRGSPMFYPVPYRYLLCFLPVFTVGRYLIGLICISGPFLILAPEKCASWSTPNPFRYPYRFPVGNFNGSSMALPSFAWSFFFILDRSGVLSTDSQDLLQLRRGKSHAIKLVKIRCTKMKKAYI